MKSSVALLDPYWSKIHGIAKNLRKSDTGFWGSFKSTQALMSWLHYRGKCGYCDVDLIQEGRLVGGSGLTDHLLGGAKSKIGFTSHFNAVPACSRCNSIKAKWDRKNDTAELPEELTQDLHNKYVSEARNFIEARRAEADAKFQSDKSNWEKALKQRDAASPLISS